MRKNKNSLSYVFPWLREWINENKQKDKARNRKKANKYYSTDRGKEKHKETNQRFLDNNPGYLKHWREANPDKMKAYNEKARKKRRISNIKKK